MYNYLTVDGCFRGTGIRDSVEGGFIDLDSLDINSELKEKIKRWVLEYESEHYKNYLDKQNIEQLDLTGKEIARMIADELINTKVKYYSAAKMKEELLQY